MLLKIFLFSGFDTEDTESDLDTSNTSWREDFKRRLAQENKFLAEIRARRKASAEFQSGSLTANQSSLPLTGQSSTDCPVSPPKETEKKTSHEDEEDDDEEIREFYNNVSVENEQLHLHASMSSA